MQVAASATSQRSTLPWYAGLVGASSPLQARKALWGYLFLMPWLIGLIVFWLGPILASFAFSFLQYDMISAPTFVGLANYQKALSGDDDLFWPSLLRTFQYSLVVVPLGLIGALGLAMLLNRGMRGSAEDSGMRRLLWSISRSSMLTVFAAAGAAVLLGGWQGPVLPGPVWMAVKTSALLGLLVWVGERLAPWSPERYVPLAWAVLLPLAFLHLFLAGVVAL